MKHLMVLFGLLLFVTEISAQEKENKFHFGLKINPTVIWLKPVYNENDIHYYFESDERYFGGSYGIFGDYYFDENFGVSAELRLAHLKAAYNYNVNLIVDTIPPPNTIMGLNRSVNLLQLETPVSLKMRTNEIGKFRCVGQFGVVPSFNLNAKANDVYYTFSNGEIVENGKNVAEEINNVGIFLLLGAGVEYNLGSTAILAGLSFHKGYNNLVKKEYYASFRDFEAKPSYLALNLGLAF